MINKNKLQINHDILTKEEEVLLGTYIQNNTPGSEIYDFCLYKLINCNLKLVTKEAYNIAIKAGVDVDDLISEGYLGLIIAAKKFNPIENKNVRFATYSLYWIRQKILEYLYNNNLLYIPRNLAVDVCRYNKLISQYPADSLDDKTIMELLNITLTELKSIRKADVKINSINTIINNDEDNESEHSINIEDLFIDENINIFEDICKNEEYGYINNIVSSYSGKEKRLLTEHIMDESKTMLDIGNDVNLSKERIRQIKNKLLSDIKIKLEDNGIHR